MRKTSFKSPLLEAIVVGDIGYLDAAIADGLDVNATINDRVGEDAFFRPLDIAVLSGRGHAVDRLLAAGADVTAHKHEALYIAIRRNGEDPGALKSCSTIVVITKFETSRTCSLDCLPALLRCSSCRR